MLRAPPLPLPVPVGMSRDVTSSGDDEDDWLSRLPLSDSSAVWPDTTVNDSQTPDDRILAQLRYIPRSAFHTEIIDSLEVGNYDKLVY